MSLLEMGGKRFTIPEGEVTLGSDPGSAIALSGAGILPKHAYLKGLADGQVSIRKAAPEAEVTINGVRLGAEPTPLLHGDKVQVGGSELTFVDERRSGSTQFVSAMDLSKMAPPPKGAAAQGKVPGTTGGRVVCLTDGREYAVVGASLTFGREAGCDVVVPGKDVSRKHAEIHASPKGYFVVDLSTNGTFVNDERVAGQRVLVRGDVVRIGEESFRFYADAAPAASAAPPGPPAGGGPAASTPSPQPSPAPSTPPSGAESKLRNTSFGMPATPRPAAGGGGGAATPEAPPRRTAGTPAPSTPSALGNFLVRNGVLKGQRITLKTPNISIGRADYNDMILPDESVSTAHAKLQRREGVWVLMDLESTNGTYVDGEKITADTPLAPGAMVRFGDVQLMFEPTDDALGVAKGGGTKVMGAFKAPGAPPPPPPPKAAPAPAPPAPGAAKPKATVPSQKPVAPKAAAPKRSPPAPAPQPPPEKKGKGCGASAAVLVLSAAALAYWVLA